MDTSKVTRVEVIGEGQRLLTTYARATVELQDDGQTMKVFVVALTPGEAAAVRQAQVDGIGGWLGEHGPDPAANMRHDFRATYVPPSVPTGTRGAQCGDGGTPEGASASTARRVGT